MTNSHKTNNTSCCAPDCCDTETPLVPASVSADSVREQVRLGYGKIAEAGSFSSKPEVTNSSAPGNVHEPSGGGCCGATSGTANELAKAIGYTARDLETMPAEANMGLSCGNPTALASLKPGEVVLDLGAGGGMDCFVAGPRVGSTGQVIGVDMTPEMLGKARRNLAAYRERTGLTNVEFRLGEIEHLPVADQSVDVIISNCVINLSPDKAQVWKEIARVLKPGGRVAVSDLALLRPLPESVRTDVEALVGCVAGASLVEDVKQKATEAGLTEIVLNSKPQYIEAMTHWEDPLYQRIIRSLPQETRPSDFITSLEIRARKPQ